MTVQVPPVIPKTVTHIAFAPSDKRSILFFPKLLPYLLILVPILFNGPLTVIFVGRATGTTAVALGATVLGLLYLAVIGRKRIRDLSKANLVMPLMIYIAVFAVNVVWVGDGFGENHDTRRWINEIAWSIVAYWLALYVCRRDGSKRLRLWLVGMVFLQAVVSVSALVATGGLSRLASIASPDNALRDYTAWAVAGENPLIALSAGTFAHPNLLGALLVLLFPQIIAFSRKTRNQSSWLLTAIVGSCVLLAILLTVSRGVWLGLGIVMVVFAFFGQKWTYLIALIAALGTFLVLVWILPPLQVRLNDETTVFGRQNLLDQGLDAYAESPWFGYGLAFFASEDPARRLFMNPHNDYLTRLLGGGAIGLAAFLLVFCWILFLSVGARLRNPIRDIRFEATVTLAGCLALMGMMAFNPIQQVFPLLPVTFALFEAQRNAVQETSGSRIRRRLVFRVRSLVGN